MAKTQIIFVGGREDAAWESLVKFKDSETNKIIGFYSERSKDVWERIKARLEKKITIEDVEVDLSDMKQVLSLLRGYLQKKENFILNVTGAPKELLLGIILLGLDKSYSHIDIVMLQVGGKEIVFSPAMLRYAICDINGKTKKFLEAISEQLGNGEELSLSELQKKLNRSKATLSESIARMEQRKIIIKRREKNKIFVKLNPFAKSIIDILILKETKNGGKNGRK
ncbi:MAG: hypothetical protein QXP22_02605 [Candidatus Anstonellales archaeon]